MKTMSLNGGRQVISVPSRSIYGGFNEKYDYDSYSMSRAYLQTGLLSPQDYEASIKKLNDRLKPSRANGIDTALLVTGPLMVPLAVWGVRHKKQAKKRKRLLREAIDEFNADHPTLFMRYHRKPSSKLTIEKRIEEFHGPPPPRTSSSSSNRFSYTKVEATTSFSDPFTTSSAAVAPQPPYPLPDDDDPDGSDKPSPQQIQYMNFTPTQSMTMAQFVPEPQNNDPPQKNNDPPVVVDLLSS